MSIIKILTSVIIFITSFQTFPIADIASTGVTDFDFKYIVSGVVVIICIALAVLIKMIGKRKK